MKTRRVAKSPPLNRPRLEALLEAARKAPPMTPAEQQLQRISFAYGNASFDNTSITKDMVRDADFAKYGDLSKEKLP